MLTCKSLFGLGYRGERLIEPLMLVVKRWFIHLVLLLLAAKRRCQIAGTLGNASTTASARKLAGAPALTGLGMVRMLTLQAIGSQVPLFEGCSSQTKWQWVRAMHELKI